MPPRLISVAILLFWSVATWRLIQQDLLPEFTLAAAPDLRTITRTEADTAPARWNVLVIDKPSEPENRRKVGKAVTQSIRQPNGCVQVKSSVKFDSGGLLKQTTFENRVDDEIEVNSSYQIDVSGNLQGFQVNVTTSADGADVLSLVGRLKNRSLEITMRGPVALLNQTRTIPYESKGVVQNTLGPLDRLPGLRVGQRWDVHVINPLTGRAEVVRFAVTRKCWITWDKSPVQVLEVVQKMGPIPTRTWVRSDGLVLRQNVPLPGLELVLERRPETDSGGPRGAFDD